jgi:ubiquinone/menaquinone biosynthesis C-methylase UbiE
MPENNNKIKEDVRNYWDNQACGTWVTDKDKYTLEYFEEIEEDRYSLQPEIFSFAEFTRYHGKKMLEVGVGAGTDFLQWVRAGTEAHGIDLTREAVEHVRYRLSLYGLEAKDIRVGDSESLPYDDDSFDVVYSWGVIHHTPNTEQAMREIIRVCRPGGTCKVMIYHRRSILAYLFWVKHALLKFRPWKSISWALWNYMESIGTKAYTRNEVREMLRGQPVEDIKIRPVLSYYDKLGRFNPIMRGMAKALALLLGGDKAGWFMTIEFKKK